MQEILQVHFDKELWGPEHKGQFESGVPVEHHDGPQEVLQPSLPLPNCCSREWIMIMILVVMMMTTTTMMIINKTIAWFFGFLDASYYISVQFLSCRKWDK